VDASSGGRRPVVDRRTDRWGHRRPRPGRIRGSQRAGRTLRRSRPAPRRSPRPKPPPRSRSAR